MVEASPKLLAGRTQSTLVCPGDTCCQLPALASSNPQPPPHPLFLSPSSLLLKSPPSPLPGGPEKCLPGLVTRRLTMCLKAVLMGPCLMLPRGEVAHFLKMAVSVLPFPGKGPSDRLEQTSAVSREQELSLISPSCETKIQK